MFCIKYNIGLKVREGTGGDYGNYSRCTRLKNLGKYAIINMEYNKHTVNTMAPVFFI